MSDIKPDIIIWTGDNAPHNIWEEKKEDLVRESSMIAYLIQFKFNVTIPIYPAVGK